MSFGTNLQFLRKLCNKMTQEELAEKIQVSRQTISKWEMDAAYPETDKAILLCELFSCTMDNLFRDDLCANEEAYSNIRIEQVDSLRYVRYAVISADPEKDAMDHVREWAENCGITSPQIIGWDFPFVSQEQINVFHMHGYTAAWLLPPELTLPDNGAEVLTQEKQQYAAITIKDPFRAAFRLIPNAYRTLMTYIRLNGLKQKQDPAVIQCFEKTYFMDQTPYLDVLIAVE